MRFSVIIIDDEFYSLKDLEFLLSSFPNLKVVATFKNVLDAINYVTDNGPVDIIFCDIVMPKVDGLEASPILSKYCTAFVFTTGHPEFAIEGYGKGAKDYFLKPVKRTDVENLLQNLPSPNNGGNEKEVGDMFFLRDGLKKISQAILLNDIIYIVSYGNYIKIITATGEHTHLGSLKMVEEKYVSKGKFIRIHRSAIAAKSAIDKVSANNVYLSNGESHPIGKTYRAKMQEFQKKNLFVSNE
jgi:DNA-binding LytR/AlgR family response regulator